MLWTRRNDQKKFTLIKTSYIICMFSFNGGKLCMFVHTEYGTK